MTHIFPFELHLTVDKLTPEQQAKFVAFCFANEAKPLMIELAKGDFVDQPMFSKIIYAIGIEFVLEIATHLSNAFEVNGFVTKRLKIEVPLGYTSHFYDHKTNFNNYFEWHGKIEFKQTEKLEKICEKHKAHLSLNAIKHDQDSRFITLREFGGQKSFENRVAGIIGDLTNGNWPLIKQESEYCIYDNNCFLDKGWLPQ